MILHNRSYLTKHFAFLHTTWLYVVLTTIMQVQRNPNMTWSAPGIRYLIANQINIDYLFSNLCVPELTQWCVSRYYVNNYITNKFQCRLLCRNLI